MKIYTDLLSINGTLIEKENPMAYLCAADKDINCVQGGTFSQAASFRFGKDCAPRVLPYKMQSGYSRELTPLKIKTIVVENEHLKAVFLPEYGGKLWSLFSKDENRELLFCNSVFRPANLAIRDAWAAGGIEWNLGHTGHCVYTCSDVYCVKMQADGEEFLRIYEYEAISEQVMQLDIHLPSGAKQLRVHMRIENTLGSDQPLYWWTNTAIPLSDKTRVFSGTNSVLFQLPYNPRKPSHGFFMGEMPNDKYLENIDMSFPARIPISAEYFFQNSSSDDAPWEVCVQDGGNGLYERSTQPLFARKMFCWGESVGGNHWCDFLSEKGKGKYIEIQAGLAPSQLHTAVIKKCGVVSFTQIFGAYQGDASALTKTWHEAQNNTAKIVENLLPASEVNALNDKYKALSTISGGEILHIGGGYAALEQTRRAMQNEQTFAPHLTFSIVQNSDYSVWQSALKTKVLPKHTAVLPYLTQPAWLSFLKELYASSKEQAAYYYAVALAENRQDNAAIEVLDTIKTNAFAVHLLAEIAKRKGDEKAATDLYVKAYILENNTIDASFAEDAIRALVSEKSYARAWEIYGKIPPQQRSDAAELAICAAAVKLNELDFLQQAFAKEFAGLREGAEGLANIYQEYVARLKSKQENREYTDSDIDDSVPIPYALDFKMFSAIEPADK